MAKEIRIGSKYDIRKAAIKYLVRDFINVYNSEKSVNPRTCPECMEHIETGIFINGNVYCKKCIDEVIKNISQTS
ncbi:MAG: hypothetical protein IB618_02090 [Candidatus Pacearchaeota archaeon]|nr:MAG: hypothetical protein IB618_02090 [Candidatus Pacearchaeota archaeon]